MAVNHPITPLAPQLRSTKSSAADGIQNALKVPLYISALIGILAAFYAIDGVIDSPLLSWSTAIVAIFGTCFSMAYRQAKMPASLLTWGITLIVVGGVLSIVFKLLDLSRLMPDYSLQGDLSLAVVIQCMTAAYTFAMVDDKRVLMSSIVSMAMIGLVATYSVNGDLIIAFLVYMIATTFLLLHQSYLMFSQWGHKQLSSRQNGMLLRTQMGYAIIGALVSLGIGTILVIPLQVVGAHMSLAGALKGLANLEPNNAVAAEAAQDISDDIDDDTSTFAIGQGPTSDDDDHIPLIIFKPEDNQEHYWRGRTYDHYTGNGWISTLKDAYQSPRPPVPNDNVIWYGFASDPADSGIDPKYLGKQISVQIQVGSFTSSTLYMPANVRDIGVNEIPRFECRLYNDGLVQLPDAESHESYWAACCPTDASPSQLIHDTGNTYPQLIQNLYVTQRGDNITASDALRFQATIKSIVGSLKPSQQNEFFKVVAIRDWVASRALYSLDVDPTPDGQDAVSNFLFKTREGYCDLFASSMALLCRYAGIPARVATGFDPGARRESGGFSVSGADKHAWCEVYFPGYGWQTFDPTAGTKLAPAHSRSFSLLNWLKSAAKSIVLFMKNAGVVPSVLGIVIIAALALIVRNEVLPKLFPRIRFNLFARKSDKSKTLSENTWEERSDRAHLAASERWAQLKVQARRWRHGQDDNETCNEFTRSLSSAVSIAAQIKDTATTGPTYEPVIVTEAIRRLSRDFIAAKYANDAKSDEYLVGRNEDSSAQEDLAKVTAAARTVPKRKSSVHEATTQRYTYSLRSLASDPLGQDILLEDKSTAASPTELST